MHGERIKKKKVNYQIWLAYMMVKQVISCPHNRFLSDLS
jgi:hypothetical protein